MSTPRLCTIALVAATLTGCSVGVRNDEPVTAAPVPPETVATTPLVPAVAKVEERSQTSDAHIDASAFINALVESGCQIDKAEYKEVKRGGAIKVICSKTTDALELEFEDL